jgi:hypothetical protein
MPASPVTVESMVTPNTGGAVSLGGSAGGSAGGGRGVSIGTLGVTRCITTRGLGSGGGGSSLGGSGGFSGGGGGGSSTSISTLVRAGRVQSLGFTPASEAPTAR